MAGKPATHIYDGDQRQRVVVERVHLRRPHFEALIPNDATEGEVAYFCAQVVEIMKRRRERAAKVRT